MGKSNKPPSVQAAVVVKALNGDSKSQIARDLEISRNTVNAILEDSELSKLVLEGKTTLHRLIPKSLAAFDYAITRHKIPEATIILRATGVLPQEITESSGPSVNINLGAIPRPRQVNA